MLAGADQQEVELEPAGDRLEGKGSFKVTANTNVLAVVSLQASLPERASC